MFSRLQPLGFPITLGIVMIVLVVVLIVGWVILAAVGAVQAPGSAGAYWAALSIGTTFLALVLAGVVTYLALSVKAINLNRRQSNFIDSVTHELKSPIASLKLCVQTLGRRQLAPDEYASFCRYMLEDVERLDRLINHVLDAARLEHGAAAPEPPADVELGELIAQCGATAAAVHHAPPDAVTYDLEPCLVHAARVDLEMIFRNLLDNAVKYAGSPPRIAVALRCRPDGPVTVRIADNGPGIPRPMRRKIFGRFVRLGSELERKQVGTGLGLHIVRTLIRRLKGRIRIRDPQNGTGTVFEVELPAARRVDAPPPREHAQPTVPSAEPRPSTPA
jgi:signal transduction histidine kinase